MVKNLGERNFSLLCYQEVAFGILEELIEL